MFKTGLRKKTDVGGLFAPIVLSVLGSAVILLISLSLCSLAATFIDLPQTAITPLATMSIALATFVSGVIFSGMFGKHGVATGALIGIVTFAVLLIIALFNDLSSFTTTGIVKFLLIVISGALGGFCGVGLKKGR